MTERSLPWNGTTVGDPGPYSDANWQFLWQYIIGLGGMRANVGVFLGSGTQPYDGLRVQAQNPTTTAVDVLPGSALVQGIAYINDSTESFVIAANASGNPRIDMIVVQADYTQQTARLALIQGTPAASPVPPSLTQTPSVMWEIPIADIAVANGFTSISQSNITSRREWVNAPPGVFLDNVLNNSGAVLEDGDVVIWDTSVDRAVTTTTTEDNRLTVGVWRGRTAAAGYGRVQVRGIGYVRANAAVTRGQSLTTSTTARQAAVVAGPCRNIGDALETTSTAGLVLCAINMRYEEDYILARDQQAQNTAGGSFNSGAWQTRVLNTLVANRGGSGSLGSNRVTLQPGTYRFKGHAPARAVNLHQVRLQNITAGTTVAVGTSEQSNSGAINQTRSFIEGRFTITTASAFELQHQCQTTAATTGFGSAANFTTEVYAVLEFWREVGL